MALFNSNGIDRNIMLRRKETANNILVVSIQGDQLSEDIAAYYKLKRNIPDVNMLAVTDNGFRTGGVALFGDSIEQIRDYIKSSGLNIRGVQLCGDFPNVYTSGVGLGASNAIYTDLVKSCLRFPVGGFDTTVEDWEWDVAALVNPFVHPRISLKTKNADSNAAFFRHGIANDFVKSVKEDARRRPAWIKPFKPNTYYPAGQIVTSSFTTNITEYLAMIVAVAGTVGADPTALDNATPDFNYLHTDGNTYVAYTVDAVVFLVDGTGRDAQLNPIPQVVDNRTFVTGSVELGNDEEPGVVYPQYLPPLNQREIESDDFFELSVAKLCCSPIHPSDTQNASTLDVVKRIIDDSIAVEAMNLTELPGKVVMTDSNSGYASGIPILLDAMKYFPTAEFIYDATALNGTVGDEAMAYEFYGTPDPLETYPSGQSSMVPTHAPATGDTFLPLNNVFVQSMGNQTYFNRNKKPYAYGDISYTKGAICMFGQSCGAGKMELSSIDPRFTQLAGIDMSINANSAVKDSGNRFQFYSDYGRVTNPFGITYEGNAVADPKFQAVNATTINLLDGTTVLHTVTLPNSFTILDLYSITMPADWFFNLKCPGAESRAMTAIKMGACVASGSGVEPRTSNGTSSAGWMIALLQGLNLSEALRHANFGGSGNAIEERGKNNNTIGDLLYRPFHRLF